MSHPRLMLFVPLMVSLVLIGCAKPFHVRATDYQLSVELDPAEHKLSGRANITFRPIPDRAAPEGEVWVALDLNRDLKVSNIEVQGAELKRFRKTRALYVPKHHEKVDPIYRSHKLYLEAASDEITVTVDYQGTLEQDVASGEKAGEIHNFEVSAHTGPEGTYLSPGGHWYPTPSIEDQDSLDPDLLLAEWSLHVNPIPDYELIASARRVDGDADGQTWHSPHDLTSIVLTGGPLDVWSRQVGDVDVRVHLKRTADAEERAKNEIVAQNYLDHTATYIERYDKLLGPFPYDQYSIIENFFSSGFAFPMLTLFGPVVMHMGDNSFRHGYLDHEMVHSWWGCGVEVDPRDGNWCEALTSYCTNYYGFIEEADMEGARKKRRDQSNFLSRVKPEYDKPVGTYGLKDGAGRGIAYSKGAAVFHMIAREIGQDNFWSACHRVTEQYTGKHATWTTLKDAFEEASGQNLDDFFAQWVNGAGAPMLELKEATFDASSGKLAVVIDQGEKAFSLSVPLHIRYEDGREVEVVVQISESPQTITLAPSGSPIAVELDPDYHVFRKLHKSEIMPTTATTKSAKHMMILVPTGEFPDAYTTVADRFEEPVKKKKDGQLVKSPADDSLTPEKLSGGGILVLGDSVRHPEVQKLLARTVSPVRWIEGGFAIGDQSFTEPNHAVLFTVHHPDSPDDGITVYAGNSETALANAAILGFYANSLLVFEANERTEVIVRKDFESQQRIEVLATN